MHRSIDTIAEQCSRGSVTLDQNETSKYLPKLYTQATTGQHKPHSTNNFLFVQGAYAGEECVTYLDEGFFAVVHHMEKKPSSSMQHR